MGKKFSQNLILSASSDLQKIRSLLVVITMSVVLALLGKFSIILPFSPIPFVIQAHVCLFLGLCLPRHQAVGAVALFLIQGLCGLPVFALGQGGLPVLLGPRGGYLLGYIVGTWVTSYVYQKIQTQEYIK
ncbi:MAG: biotin transporter BioY, partial [Leptospiraceae bacterium]|nr:biotin transporter BioY [Leptospiraceae bacterium]